MIFEVIDVINNETHQVEAYDLEYAAAITKSLYLNKSHPHTFTQTSVFTYAGKATVDNENGKTLFEITLKREDVEQYKLEIAALKQEIKDAMSEKKQS